MARTDWIEVKRDFESAIMHFKMSQEIYNKKDFETNNINTYILKNALMHSMQSGYTSLENGLKRILKVIGENPPVGDNSHSDLLRRVSLEVPYSRPEIISQDFFEKADKVRRFRHVAVRSYDGFDPMECEDSVLAAKQLTEIMIDELNTFIDYIDPPGDDGNGDGSGGGSARGPAI